jgi:PAS domain S-box-containing protein
LILMALTEIVLPGLEIPAPRLGALSVMLMGGVVWLFSAGLGEYVPPSSAFARQVLNTLDDGVALITTDGRIRAVNPSLARLCGRVPESLVQGNVSEILGETLAQLRSELVHRETLLEQAIGEAIPISLSSSMLFDRDGSLLGSVLVMRDQRAVVELRRRLVATGRLAAVGELAAGIAHEVNNPLAFIQANLHCLQRNEASLLERIEKEAPEDSRLAFLAEGRHLIGQSLQEIARVSAIVKEIRGFSHMGPGELQWNDVNGLLESSLRIALPRLRRSARLEIERGDLPQVHCAGQDLKQVFLDLILTAARSMESSGAIKVRTALEGDRVSVRIEDDGPGISEKDLERVYDPALLGEPGIDQAPDYSVSYQIVLQHGGEMEIESPSEGGTRVCIRLPICEPGAADEVGESQEYAESQEDEPNSDSGAADS